MKQRPVPILLAFLGLAVSLAAQDAPVEPTDREQDDPTVDMLSGPPIRLDVSRRTLRNFLTDQTALIPFLSDSGAPQELRDVFIVGSNEAGYAFFWDPTSCRLIGVLDLELAMKASRGEATEETEQAMYVMQASGAFPFSAMAGASWGRPGYFGFRMVNGKPEFLYTHGTLAVEERLWLDEGGRVLKQRFSLGQTIEPVRVLFPELWRDRIESADGTWSDNILTVPPQEDTTFVVTYRLRDQPDSES
ncbi:MAG: hypothetical protein AAF236_15965 [Verrucomicrobiota bacterium]